MYFKKNIIWIISAILVIEEISADEEYNILHTDGSYDFGYNNPDNYHYAQANRNNIVKGEFGGRNPKTGGIDTVHYTAGPRGYRPRGKNIVRKYDLNQSGRRPVGSKDDPYYDPYEDPSYSFSFRTNTYNRDENANRVGDVNGRYSYIDDVGERHNVEFVAGKNTGFHVKTPFPDSNPRAYGPLYFRGRGKPIPRGRTSIQRGLDGSYKFVSAGPDQRRTETSDSTGHVRGSYTYLDDKGVQHAVHYIAGPETGYRVLKNVKGPHLPSIFPFQHPDIIPPDFYDEPEIFNTAASDHGQKPTKPGFENEDNGLDEDDDFSNKPKAKPRPGGNRPPYDDDSFGIRKPIAGKPSRPPPLPIDGDDSGYDTDFGDLFGGGGNGGRGGGGRDGGGGGGRGGGSKATGGGSRGDSTTVRPTKPPSVYSKPGSSKEDSFGSSKEDSSSLSKEDGSYKSSKNGLYIPPVPTKPARPGGSSEEDYGFGNKPGLTGDYGDDFSRDRAGSGGKPSITRPPIRGGNRSPISSEEDVDFGGLFGSESNRPKPPYGGTGTGPVITIGSPNKNCPKCEGAVLTNVGDTYLAVPPGVSVRAHVQAIDLLPYSSRFPGPSDQYKADISLKTEQLNAAKDKIISKKDDINKNTGKYDDKKKSEAKTVFKGNIGNRISGKNKEEDESTEDNTTEETTTEIVPTTFSPKRVTNK